MPPDLQQEAHPETPVRQETRRIKPSRRRTVKEITRQTVTIIRHCGVFATKSGRVPRYCVDEAVEHEVDAACDRLNAAEHAIIETPAASLSDISVKLKVLYDWATMTDEPEALSWLFDAINTDLTRLEGDQLIAA